MKAGQVENGRFQGRVISYERDGEGRVVRRRETDTNTGALMQEIEFGPYGRTGDTWYEGGKIRERDQLWYDANGHLSDVTSWDANGRESRRGHVVYSKDGELLDDTSWEHGVLAWHEHNDPVTKTETFTAFDEAGGVKLTRTIKDKKLVEFREPTPSMNEYGDSWYDSATPNDTVKISCHADGRCEHFAIHFEFLDAARRTPKSAEWRDESGKVLYAAYYEYELDAHGNWTHRKVFVTGPDLPERTLYEEDARTVTYWGR